MVFARTYFIAKPKIIIMPEILPIIPSQKITHYSYLILKLSPIIPLLIYFVNISNTYSYPQSTDK